MAQAVEKLAVTVGPEAAAAEEPRGGVTPAAVLTGAALFLMLAWALPAWSLTKSYPLGMGGYLPLEAFFLTLLLLVFNRFGGALALVLGLAAAALFTPCWHAAVYAKTPAAAKMLPAASAWLYGAFAGLIEPAQKSQWTPTMLVAAGALAAFAAGALPGWLAAAAAPALRRRLVWRELLVVFVLVAMGSYSCRAVEFLVGVLVVPYKDDTPERKFKERFVRPVPIEQDPENTAGIPSKLVPYDIHNFNPGGFDAGTPEGQAGREAENRAAEEEKAALKKWRMGINRELAAIAAPEGDPGSPQYRQEYAKYRQELAEKRSAEWRKFLAHWKGPLAWWLPLLGLILLVQVFLAALMRRQWSDHEKLMFPHAEVVRALAEGSDLSARSRRVLASPALWIGAGVSGAVFLFQGLNNYFPTIPAPNLQSISLSTFISERPWTAMERNISAEPYLVSIGYLLTTEVSLSIWAFGVINQALRVAASAWGLPRDDAWAVHGEWMNSDALYTGAMLIFVGWLVWGGRRHIWYVLRRGLGLVPADTAEGTEPMGYPTAFWGFWLCLAGILLWCVLAGLKLWVMAVLFGLYLAMVVVISRVVAEAGLLTCGAGFWPYYPQFVFSWIFGFGQGAGGQMIAYQKGWLGAGGTLIPVTLRAMGVWSFIWPSMLHVLPLSPFLLTAFKLTETEPRRKRLLTWLMVAALVAGVLIFLHGTLVFAFEKGSQGTKFLGFNCPSWAFNNWLLRDVVNKERMWTPDFWRVGMMATGGVVMTALLIFRSLFYWWPLHPLGMVAIGIDGVWFCFLLGWIFKRAALAYGGGDFSQRVNPFFYGLIVGQFAMAGFWMLVGLCGTSCPDSGGLLPGM